MRINLVLQIIKSKDVVKNEFQLPLKILNILLHLHQFVFILIFFMNII